MAGGIAKAAKSPIHPCITPEPHAGGKCTKCIGTDVIPKILQYLFGLFARVGNPRMVRLTEKKLRCTVLCP
jgi:hypothetical protein